MAIVFLPTRTKQFGEQEGYNTKDLVLERDQQGPKLLEWKIQQMEIHKTIKRGEQNLKDLQQRVPWSMSIGSHLTLR
jgi:hypothetical protein